MLSKEDLEHQRKLFTYFSSQDWPVLKAELEQYRVDLSNYLLSLDVSKEDQKVENIRSKAQLDLVDTWLKLPEENKNFLQQAKDLFVGLFN